MILVALLYNALTTKHSFIAEKLETTSILPSIMQNINMHVCLLLIDE